MDIFATRDIETIQHNNRQVPVAISLAYNILNNVNTKLFLIDYKLFKLSDKIVVDKLWSDFFKFTIEHFHLFKTIFVHNLGSFDGFFLYKALINFYSNNPDCVSAIIDDKNKFIQISLNLGSSKII